VDDALELRASIQLEPPRRGERFAIVESAETALRMPLGEALRGPLRTFVRVAVAAGIRRADRGRQVRTRHAQTMIAAIVDDHVRLGPHMAIDAVAACDAGRMMVMCRGIESARQMAARA